MRLRTLLVALVGAHGLLLGCGSEDGAPGSADDGGLADAPRYTADDFQSFEWRYVGTGVGSNFAIDRDCGIEAGSYSSGKPPVTVTGTAAKDDCVAFETLVLSPAVVRAFATDPPCVPAGTDDNRSMTVRLVDGGVLGRATAGCEDRAPYSDISVQMQRLQTLYASPTKDGGTDTGASSDATADGD